MARVSWSREALAKLDIIADYIAAFDRNAAVNTAGRLLEAGESLAHFPNRGRRAEDGNREFVTIRPYILTYSVDGGTVTILDIRHSAQG